MTEKFTYCSGINIVEIRHGGCQKKYRQKKISNQSTVRSQTVFLQEKGMFCQTCTILMQSSSIFTAMPSKIFLELEHHGSCTLLVHLSTIFCFELHAGVLTNVYFRAPATMLHDWSRENDVFNLTMTHRLDSDIPWPYCDVVDRTNGNVIAPRINMKWEKPDVTFQGTQNS
jgi:hypothetical protein